MVMMLPGFVSRLKSWDISTLSYNQTKTSFNAPQGMSFTDDYLNCYIVSENGGNYLYKYTLSSAGDINTMTLAQTVDLTTGSMDRPMDVFVKGDGSKIYVLCEVTDEVFQYNFGTNNDLTTLSYQNAYDTGTQDIRPYGLFIKPDDGTKFYISGRTSDYVRQYDMSTGWDISTSSYDSKYLDYSAKETSDAVHYISPNGKYCYVTGETSNAIHQYEMSTVWEIDTGSFVRTQSVSSQSDRCSGIWFKPNGLKMYLSDYEDNNLYEYDLG